MIKVNFCGVLVKGLCVCACVCTEMCIALGVFVVAVGNNWIQCVIVCNVRECVCVCVRMSNNDNYEKL